MNVIASALPDYLSGSRLSSFPSTFSQAFQRTHRSRRLTQTGREFEILEMDSSSSSPSPFGVRSTGSEEDGDRIGRGKAENLYQDLMVEILVRLPVKTLLRFKSVSKLWYSLITSPNFISLHSTHSYRKKKVSLLFLRMVLRRPEATVSFRFDQFVEELTIRGDNVEIVGCFNGVVCLSLSYRPKRYALWNPATRQLREIEVPKEIEAPRRYGLWSGNGFCFDPVTNSFTVANITLTCAIRGGGEKETIAHIVQFSTTTNSWTQNSKEVPYCIWETGKSNTFVCPSISCVNGYMHCRVAIFRDMNAMDYRVADDMYILSYDMIGGVFERIEMPFPPIRHRVQLANCGGSLAVIAEDDDTWVMNDCGGADQSWSKLVTCRRPSKVGPGVEVFIESNGELVIVREPRETVLLERCYPYSESLASLY